MISLRRWLDKKRDRRPVIRITRGSYRKPWWRRSGRVLIVSWLLLVLLLLLIAAITALLGSARALPIAPATATELADSA